MKSQLLLTTIAAVVLVGCGNPEADRALFDAASDGNIEDVRKYLDAGANINAKDYDGLTPLHLHLDSYYGNAPDKATVELTMLAIAIHGINNSMKIIAFMATKLRVNLADFMFQHTRIKD